jgi:flavodoxin
MDALIIFDSAYGNTEAIARAIGAGIGEEARIASVADAHEVRWSGLDLLIVGSPTQGGRPTTAISALLKSIPSGALERTKVAAFDTRFSPAEHGYGLRILMKVIGFAAPRIAGMLQAKGGRLIVPAEGFIVQAKEGPLRPGEIERATAWAQQIRVKAGE